jgi:hypothetical protein
LKPYSSMIKEKDISRFLTRLFAYPIMTIEGKFAFGKC